MVWRIYEKAMGSALSPRFVSNTLKTSNREFKRLLHTQLINLLGDGTFSEMAAFINDTVSSLPTSIWSHQFI